MQRLMVPVDGSAASWRAVDTALRLARGHDVSVDVFEIVFSREDVRQADQRLAVGLSARDLAGLDVTHHAEAANGPAAAKIEQLLTLHPESTLVMASHGRGRSSAILGSVTEDVLRRTFGPVLVVGPNAEPDDFLGPVVVSVDGTPTSEASLPLATAWATELGVEVWILHVSEPGVGQSSDTLDSAYVARLAQSMRSRTGRDFEFDELHGSDPSTAVAEYATHLGASLIVSTTHARSGWPRLVDGSVTSGFVRHATCPVLEHRLPHPQDARPDRATDHPKQHVATSSFPTNEGHEPSAQPRVEGAATGQWVVGTDGSDGAEHAVRWAVANAPERAKRLQIVTSWQSPIYGPYPPLPAMTTPIDNDVLRADAQALADDTAARCSDETDITVDAVAVHGGASASLLNAAEHSDLLVVGSRGRGGFQRLLLGSTSTQCAAHAVTPTVVVPGSAPIVSATQIAVGLDGSENSIAALHWAINFASDEATINVLSAWDTSLLAAGADYFFSPEPAELAEDRFHGLVAAVIAEHDRRVHVQENFLRESPRSALRAAGADADILVVGARGHGMIGTALLGSVSTWLLHNSEVPVVVVPAQASVTNSDAADSPES